MDGPDRLPPPRPDKAALMRRFDDLPADARRAMSCAAYQFHPVTAEKMLARGVASERVGESLRERDHGCYVRTEPAL
jgi:hypothetical protein